MQRQREKMKLYREEVKERFTTHWDLDYMTTAEIEAAMATDRHSGNSKPITVPEAVTGVPRTIKRVFAFLLGKHAETH